MSKGVCERLRVVGLRRWSRRKHYWGLLVALAPFAYWGAELKLLTGERGRLKVIGTPKGITAQRL